MVNEKLNQQNGVIRPDIRARNFFAGAPKKPLPAR
jgi:hypothetical protein